MKRYSSSSHKRGLSFIEALVVITVTTLIMGVIVSSVIYFYRSNAIAVEQAFAINSARKGVELMVRDIREAAYGDDGSFPVVGIDDNEFSFYSDVDRDDAVELIRYFLDGTNLYKGVTEPSGNPLVYDSGSEVSSLVSDYVRNGSDGIPIFSYYDVTGAVIADYADVSDLAFVKVNLVVNINPIRAPGDFTLRSSATLRNLRPNL